MPAAARGVPPDEAVTYRVREAAAEDPLPAPGRADRLRRAVVGLGRRARLGRGSGPAGRAGLGHRSGRAGQARSGRGRPRRLLVAGSAGLLALTAAAVVVGGPLVDSSRVLGPLVGGPLVGGSVVDGPRAAGAPSSTPPVPTAEPASPGRGEPTGPVLAGGAGRADVGPTTGVPGGLPAGEDLTGTVTALVRAREGALRTGDVEALGLVHDRGGTTWAADERLLRDGPVDVAYEVLEVAPVTDHPGEARVRLRTTVDGSTTTEEVVLGLVPGPSGWRLRAVTG